MSHTPGPWHAKLLPGFDDDGQPFASVWVEAGEYTSIANLIPHKGVQGNAHLIAAAPDMLAALREVAHHAEDECGFMVMVRAAIAKAEGQSA